MDEVSVGVLDKVVAVYDSDYYTICMSTLV